MKFLRWVILGATCFFVVQAFRAHWQEVAALEFTTQRAGVAFASLAVTLLAHVWSAVVWSWILQFCDRAASLQWVLPVYLKTNLAKYVPGNVWHLYGRTWAVKATGAPFEVALLSVLLEPLLMAAAAVCIAVVAGGTELAAGSGLVLGVVAFGGAMLAGVHPRVLNPALSVVAKLKGQNPAEILRVERYPWRPLAGEVGFVLLRGLGFVVAIAAFVSVPLAGVPLLLAAFSCAWFLGLVIPTPGGMGVFEATAIALLDGQFAAGPILAGVAVFRLLSLGAEAIAAGIATLVPLPEAMRTEG